MGLDVLLGYNGKSSASLTRFALDDWPEISARILNGATLSEIGGLYGAGWAWQALTAAKLRTH